MSGPNDYLASRATRALRDLLHDEDPSLEVIDLEAASYGPGGLFALASPSLFGEPRLVRVEGVAQCSDAFIEDMIAYLAQPAAGITLVLRHSGGNRAKRLLDAVRQSPHGYEVACPELKREQDRIEFVRAEFHALGRRITPPALRALVAAFGEDIAELASAVRQLCSDSADEIDEPVVNRYYGGRVETTAFAVADLALAGRLAEAMVALRQAVASGSEPVPIVAAFAMKLRAMAKVFGRREPAARLASSLGMAAWQIDRARNDLTGWTDDGLARAIRQVALTDAAVKGEARDGVFAIEQLVTVIARKGNDVSVSPHAKEPA